MSLLFVLPTVAGIDRCTLQHRFFFVVVDWGLENFSSSWPETVILQLSTSLGARKTM
jgi:hypothetical protein